MREQKHKFQLEAAVWVLFGIITGVCTMYDNGSQTFYICIFQKHGKTTSHAASVCND